MFLYSISLQEIYANVRSCTTNSNCIIIGFLWSYRVTTRTVWHLLTPPFYSLSHFFYYYYIVIIVWNLTELMWSWCYSIFSFICVMFCRSLFVLLSFFFGHCVVCSSSIYGFWLPLWHLQTLLTIYVNCNIICHLITVSDWIQSMIQPH